MELGRGEETTGGHYTAELVNSRILPLDVGSMFCLASLTIWMLIPRPTSRGGDDHAFIHPYHAVEFCKENTECQARVRKIDGESWEFLEFHSHSRHFATVRTPRASKPEMGGPASKSRASQVRS